MMRRILQVVALLGWWLSATAGAMERPNILVIWGDDIGFWNLSTNNMGMMGYQTPNICLLYTSPSPRDRQKSRMPCSA